VWVVCVRACACVCVCARVCVRACVCVVLCVCIRVNVCMDVGMNLFCFFFPLMFSHQFNFSPISCHCSFFYRCTFQENLLVKFMWEFGNVYAQVHTSVYLCVEHAVPQFLAHMHIHIYVTAYSIYKNISCDTITYINASDIIAIKYKII